MSILRNPCNNLEKPMYQIWQIYVTKVKSMYQFLSFEYCKKIQRSKLYRNVCVMALLYMRWIIFNSSREKFGGFFIQNSYELCIQLFAWQSFLKMYISTWNTHMIIFENIKVSDKTRGEGVLHQLELCLSFSFFSDLSLYLS